MAKLKCLCCKINDFMTKNIVDIKVKEIFVAFVLPENTI